MYNLKKIVHSICLKSESSTKWNKIPTRASILIILTYPKHMKYYIHFVGKYIVGFDIFLNNLFKYFLLSWPNVCSILCTKII